MKNLMTFESFNPMERTNYAEEIAKDLLPRLVEIRKEKSTFTEQDFFNYVEDKGMDKEMADSVFHYIVNKGDEIGFAFDSEEEEGDNEEVGEIYLKK
jgi:hypothetical protein